MADENEDQWLYGDSQDAKDGFPENSDSQQPAENDVSYSSQDKSYQQNEDTGDDMDNQPPGVQESLEDALDATTGDNFDRENNESEQQDTLQQNNQDDDSMTNDTRENGTNEQAQDEGDGASDSESDDDVEVHIGDIKSTPAQQQYSSLNIKRGALLTTSGAGPEKLKQPGKFSIDEFETIGSINGIPAHEYNLDQLEDKPWRQPGADITDYFNYGFNEDTWRAYCERQKRMRSESGVGLILNAGGTGPPGAGPPGNLAGRVPQVTITNYNSKYSGISGPKRAGPPPGRKMAGTIDVIGSSGLGSRRNLEKSPPKENVIQVMTGDRREYSRKPPGGFPDMSVPPPGPAIPPSFDMPPPGFQEPPPYFMPPEPDPYYRSYEPTQDRQWSNDSGWQPTNITIPLTGDGMKNMGSKPMSSMVPPSMPPMMSRDMRDGHRDRDRDRRDRDRDYEEAMMRERDRDRGERERDRDRGDKESRREEREVVEPVVREEDRERDRSRSQYRHKESRHRHRSRSRSRRHKSRSRSPSRRKKKSRRSEREKSKEEASE